MDNDSSISPLTSDTHNRLRRQQSKTDFHLLETEYSEPMKKCLKQFARKLATDFEILDEEESLHEFAMVIICY